jgi:hypothetical protein
MKKLVPLAFVAFLLSVSFVSHAQARSGADYFAGKWKVLIPGTPYGDLVRIYELEKKDNGLIGTVRDSTGKEITKCSNVEVKENEVTLYYTAMGNDISITLVKKDDDHVTGNVMGTFTASGERIKKA